MTLIKKISPSVIAYLIIGVVILALRLLLMLFPAVQSSTQNVNITDPLSLVVIWLGGWIGVYLASGTGFAAMWDKEIPHFKRFIEPALIGLGVGLVSIGFDLLQPLGGESQITFPASLVAYPLAGILEEIIFRLFLATTLVWIFSNMLLRGRWQEIIFWVASIVLAIFFTLSQVGDYQNLVGDIDLLLLARFFVVIAVYFLLSAFYYRKYGFLASISMQLAYRIVWFVIWGAVARG